MKNKFSSKKQVIQVKPVKPFRNCGRVSPGNKEFNFRRRLLDGLLGTNKIDCQVKHVNYST